MKKTLLSAAALAATLCLGTAVATAQEREENARENARNEQPRDRERDQEGEAPRRQAEDQSGERDQQDERSRREQRADERRPGRQDEGRQRPGQLGQGQPGQGQLGQGQGQQRPPAIGVRLDVQGQDIIVDNVVPDSPAQEAGLRQGDIITSINGEDPRDINQFLSTMGRARAGEAIRLEVQREGETQEVEITPAPWNEVFQAGQGQGQPVPGDPQTTFRPNFGGGGQGMSREIEDLRQQVQQLQRQVNQLRSMMQQGGPGAAREGRDAPPRGPAIDAPSPRRPGLEGEARPQPAPRNEREGREPRDDREGRPERNRDNAPQREPADSAPPAAPDAE